MADAAVAALSDAACECAATARSFSREQSAEAAALADQLRAVFSRSTAAAPAELYREPHSPLLPQLPTELIVEVLQHLDARSLGCLACTCRQLYFGPPCPPRPMSLVEAAIRQRADKVGGWTPSSLPAGVNKCMPFLLPREWRGDMVLGTVAAGWNRSFFVDANGALLACGREEPARLACSACEEAPARIRDGGGADARAVHGVSSRPECGLQRRYQPRLERGGAGL
jgi:hypothetical protein